MKKLTIDNPTDVKYPFSKDWYDNPYVLYHGTSSVYSENLETTGWKMNEQPYDMNDFQIICKIYEEIDWSGTPTNSGYSVLRSYTIGGSNCYLNAKQVSFSQNYWTARNYSRNMGGESINYFFLAIDDVLNISANKKLQEEHKQSIILKINNLQDLQAKSNNHEVLDNQINRYQTILDNFSSSFFEKAKNIALKLLSKYEHIKTHHFPVVYVVQVNPEWFENHQVKFYDGLLKNLEIRAKTDIPASSIIARIDFPHGIEYLTVYSNGPQPVSWEKQEWNNTCVSRNSQQFQIN